MPKHVRQLNIVEAEYDDDWDYEMRLGLDYLADLVSLLPNLENVKLLGRRVRDLHQ